MKVLKTEIFFYFFTFQVISNIKAKGHDLSVLLESDLKKSITKESYTYNLVCDLKILNFHKQGKLILFFLKVHINILCTFQRSNKSNFNFFVSNIYLKAIAKFVLQQQTARAATGFQERGIDIPRNNSSPPLRHFRDGQLQRNERGEEGGLDKKLIKYSKLCISKHGI